MSNSSSTGPFLNDAYSRSGIYPRRELNTIGRMLSRITFGPGIVGSSGPYGINIALGAGFTGTAYAPNGVVSTGLDSDTSKRYVKYRKDTDAFSQETSMPSPWGTNEIYWDKLHTYGDIVVALM